jgi:hypothetical protein
MNEMTNDQIGQEIHQRIQIPLLMWWPGVLKQYLRTTEELKKIWEQENHNKRILTHQNMTILTQMTYDPFQMILSSENEENTGLWSQ